MPSASCKKIVLTLPKDADKKITDFMSFYVLPSTVIQQNKTIRAAYMFYYATEAGLTQPFDKDALQKRLLALVNDVLVVAKKEKFDVFNALSLMDNALFLEKTKFKPGDGSLHYYLFNYRARAISGGLTSGYALDDDKLSGIGLVML